MQTYFMLPQILDNMMSQNLQQQHLTELCPMHQLSICFWFISFLKQQIKKNPAVHFNDLHSKIMASSQYEVN